MFAKHLRVAIVVVLEALALPSLAAPAVENRAIEVVGAGASIDPLIAVEANRHAIVERLVAEHASTLATAGVSTDAFRNALNSLRADQLLAATLVNALPEITAIVAEAPVNGASLQRFVALTPRGPTSLEGVPAADAYLVRDGDALTIVKATDWRSNGQVVGYFTSATSTIVAHSVAANEITPKDGAGTGTGSWIGFTSGGNQATGPNSAVAAGSGNVASGFGAFVGAGTANQANGVSSLVIGGFDNRAVAIDSLIGAGAGNRVNGARSIIVGGGYNVANGDFSFIGGGGRDGIGATPAGTDPFRDHRAFGKWSFVGGGQGNVAGIDGNTINRGNAVVGGSHNTASGHQAFVGGGGCNTASGNLSVVVGGGQLADSAACDGIDSNVASNEAAFVGAGFANVASGAHSAIVGGTHNTASGAHAFVGAGSDNTASGTSAVALGERATASHPNSFVYSDGTAFGSGAAGSFNVRASGDVRIDDSTNIRMGSTTRQNITLWGNPDNEDSSYGIGVQDSSMYFRLEGTSTGGTGFHFFRGGIHNNAGGNPGGANGVQLAVLDRNGSLQLPLTAEQQIRVRNATQGFGAQSLTTYIRTSQAIGFFLAGAHTDAQMDAGSGGQILATVQPGAGTATVTGNVRALGFTPTSDRAQKSSFLPTDAKAILAKVVSLPISTWVYNAEKGSGVRHIGPVAQDFSKAFKVGYDDKTISLIDANGVALTAIKGLNEVIREKDARITKLERELEAIKKRIGM